jgi:hypothetical protein
MPYLRILGVLLLIVVVASLLGYVLTGRRRYLGFAWRMARYSLIFALILFALLFLERVL